MKRDMKEEIRDYKLVRWYPSLPIKWDSTHSYQYNRKLNVMVNITLRDKKIAPYVQSMPLIEPDFIEYWKKNKPKPLFITDDGVECFDRDEYIIIDYDFNKRNVIAYNYAAPYSTGVRRFKHESNADEYIWRNKPLFSYHEIWKYAPYGSPLSIFEQLAKERSEQ